MNVQDNRHYFIVDLTEHNGDSQDAIASVKQYVTSRYSSARTSWFVNSDQAQFLSDTEDKKVVSGHLGTFAHCSIVKDWITQLSQDGAAGYMFHVISRDGVMLAEVSGLNSSSLVVATHHLVSVFKSGQGAARLQRPRPVTYAPPDASPLSPDEAIALAKRALLNGGHTSELTALHQPKLRLRMVDLDPRARRNDADPVSARLIKLVVDDGLRSGWLGQFKRREGHGYEYVWLKEPPATLVAHEATPPQQGQATSASATVRLAADSTIAKPDQKPEVPLQDTSADKLAKVMQDKLSQKNNRIGSPVVPREFLYAAVERLVNGLNGQTIPVAELVGRAKAEAISDAAAAGYTRPQKWDAISECFLNMLLAAGVLEDENGVTVTDRIGARAANVAKLVPNYRDRSEAVLVEVIIRELGEVPYSDWHLFNIGLAIYQRGGGSPTPREWLVQRADFLCKLLEDEQRIEMNGERVMRARGR